MIKKIYWAIKKFFRNLYYHIQSARLVKVSKQGKVIQISKHRNQTHQLDHDKSPPRYGRIKMNQTNGKRYRHTDPRRVA